ncbi:glycosyl hydrolase, family 13 [Hyphomonas neptunium ATCC 15444]|uniref:Glycosyl hydrolase, family 13 n=2 Tax=Hyphomonas TaxID=85 RepID=Q0BZ93_HYPNA|nr:MULTISPECIES: alpha-glucosidase [Hyphomonas]ABI77241.1 glycosyl hydrolase, family 13 [Hyphomonas neptunium ATCC 15444]KCZ95289.1 glycosyl hydrolase family protein [Hyphomonas hirschiana VP5]
MSEPWWHGATIYQIYPRSFSDSNGDGIGDLPGITARLDYIASLGVDAIWISPFFKSPQADYGYDVSDYLDIDPQFGTLPDFETLIERAHGLGLRILVDLVWAHTSDQHEWFAASRASRTNPKADWYVWADAKADGTPPNNWQSVFGGPAWTWDARRGQYYMHNFLSAQPQLNGHSAEVQDALLTIARFWLDRGVDGFRLDALNYMMHDPALTDNPAAPEDGRRRSRPYDFQRHQYNQSHPDIPAFLERVRQLLDKYGNRFAVAEVGGADTDREMKLFTADSNRLQSAYGFDFFYARKLTPSVVRSVLEKWPDRPGTGWPSWAFENHDVPRALSRWSEQKYFTQFGRLKALLLASLRGNIFLYNGEELGLPHSDLAFEDLRDPEAIANWPLTLSRDGARTPMPWQEDAPNLGFSDARPWLPACPEHRPLSVETQERASDSLLAFTRSALAVRRASAALRWGRIEFIETTDSLLAFERQHKDERLLCVFNIGPETLQTSLAEVAHEPLLATGAAEGGQLGPFAGFIARV